MSHKHIETNRRVVEHNLHRLQYQTSVETLVNQTGQICMLLIQKKSKIRLDVVTCMFPDCSLHD
jgi:hypothetical protein